MRAAWSQEDHAAVLAIRSALQGRDAGLEDAEILRFYRTAQPGDSPDQTAQRLLDAVDAGRKMRAKGAGGAGDAVSQVFWLAEGRATSSRGAPVLVLRTSGELRCGTEAGEAEKYAALQRCVFERLEWGRERLGVGVDTPIMLLVDTAVRGGERSRKNGVAPLLKLLHTLPQHFPLVVDEAIVAPVGTLTEMAWKGLKPTLDPDIAGRVRLLSSSNVRDGVKTAAGPALPFLPARLGGALASEEYVL